MDVSCKNQCVVTSYDGIIRIRCKGRSVNFLSAFQLPCI